MKRPKIKELQDFSNNFFKVSPPRVKWQKMKYLAMALDDKNLIYINPVIPVEISDSLGIQGGELSTDAMDKFDFKEGEQYFFVLLHEIGHFKMDTKAPREYEVAREKLSRLWPDNKKMQHYEAHKGLLRRKLESPMNYDIRLQLFQNWLLTNDDLVQHHEVEEWAIAEFKKKRKLINKLLINS